MGQLENVKFPPLGTAFCPKQVVAMSYSLPQGRTRMSKIPTLGKARRVNFPWVARPPPTLGLNVDRCISVRSTGSLNFQRKMAQVSQVHVSYHHSWKAFHSVVSSRGGGGGKDSHMKQTGMLVVSLRGINFGFWSRLGSSGQSANILSCQGLV